MATPPDGSVERGWSTRDKCQPLFIEPLARPVAQSACLRCGKRILVSQKLAARVMNNIRDNSSMEVLNGMEIISFEDAAGWEAWLADHHDRRAGVWLKIARKNAGKASVTPADALEVALCYGWIDSHRKGLNEAFFLQKYSPRRPKSSWSKINVERVEALIAAGRMQALGLADVLAAKADGRWDAAYESQRNVTLPPDLVSALDQNEQARTRFDALGKTERYAVVLPLLKARGPADRAARLHKVVDVLAAGDNIA